MFLNLLMARWTSKWCAGDAGRFVCRPTHSPVNEVRTPAEHRDPEWQFFMSVKRVKQRQWPAARGVRPFSHPSTMGFMCGQHRAAERDTKAVALLVGCLCSDKNRMEKKERKEEQRRFDLLVDSLPFRYFCSSRGVKGLTLWSLTGARSFCTRNRKTVRTFFFRINVILIHFLLDKLFIFIFHFQIHFWYLRVLFLFVCFVLSSDQDLVTCSTSTESTSFSSRLATRKQTTPTGGLVELNFTRSSNTISVTSRYFDSY